ncbi:MAG: 2-keto-3-deoxy-galactonokinase [Pseudooceanicola sp.]|jgi:2-dehydro-3-deoxygalactonokinase|nr:2-keto-3-deoxy-galactonokinase [Pseudooceanicola sp.]
MTHHITPPTSGPDWIALDTVNARGWAMSGPRTLHPLTGDFSPEMLAKAWPGLPLVACGRPDAPLVQLPAKPLDLQPENLGNGLYAMPALSQTTPPDRIAGPLAAIAGFIAHNPGWDGVICLVGPVSRWVLISAEEVVSTQPFLTGQLMDALTSLPALSALPEGAPEAFTDGLNDAMSRPERLAAWLSALGASGSLSRLQGLLIGAELAAARPYWLGQQVAVIGPGAAYVTALETQGVPVIRTDEVAMTLAGLHAMRKRIG